MIPLDDGVTLKYNAPVDSNDYFKVSQKVTMIYKWVYKTPKEVEE